MIQNNKGQTRLPIVVIIIIGIIVLFVGWVITLQEFNLKDRDIEVFVVGLAIAALAFVYTTMKGDKLKMEGV